jgi:hypothetical protein
MIQFIIIKRFYKRTHLIKLPNLILESNAPAFIGTQIAAMASVAAGVKPFRASTLIIFSTLIWSAAIAIAMVAFDIRLTF